MDDSRPECHKVLALAFAYSGYVIDRYRFVGAYMQRFVQSADALGTHATFLPILYEIAPPDTAVPVYYHAIDYMALKKESVDITNYEPVLGYFPVGLRAGVEPGNIFASVGNPSLINIESYASRAQYIFIWQMDADPTLHARLAPYYTLSGERDSGRVYRSTAVQSRSRAHFVAGIGHDDRSRSAGRHVVACRAERSEQR